MTENMGDEYRVEGAEETPLVLVANRWSRIFVQPLLITLLVSSLMAGVTLVTQTFETTLPWMSLIWLYVLVSVECQLTGQWLDHPGRRQIDRAVYRGAELIVIVLCVRLFTWAIGGTWPQLNLLPNYLRYPLDLVDDAFFIVGLVLTLLAWYRANELGGLFARLAVDQAEISYYTQPTSKRVPGNRPISTNRGHLVMRFFRQWIGGGFLLLICTAISAFDVSEFARTFEFSAISRLVLSPTIPLAMIFYFTAGLLLLSQARLSAMNARWLIAGTQGRGNVERSWTRLTLWLILIVATVAAFLPLGSTFGISHILGFIVQAMLTVFSLIMTSLLALLSLIIPNMAPAEPVEPTAEPLPSTPSPQPATPQPLAGDDIFGMIFSSMFWTVAIVVTIMALIIFLRDRGVRLDTMRLRELWRSLVAWLGSVWRGFFTRWAAVRKAIRIPRKVELDLERPELSSPWRFLRVSGLSPREQLRYFYLSIVRRAGVSGVKRKTSETPLEYAQDLKEGWPDDEGIVDTLTQAFLKARYSRQAIEKDEVNPVKRQWKRLKSRVRKRSGREG